MQRNISLIFIFLAFSFSLRAQLDLGVHLMPGVWQAYYTNPAMFPESQVVVSLPGMYNQLWNSSFSLNDLVQKNAQGKAFLDIDGTIGLLDADNFIREQFDVHTLGLGFHAGKWFFSAGHSTRFGAYFQYPKTLAQLVWKGNAQFIGQAVTIGPNTQVQGYHEVFFGAGVRISNVITAGVRFKLLNGLGDASTSRYGLTLFTSDDIYQSTLNADFQINATANIQYQGFDDFSVGWDKADFKLGKVFGGNPGIAADLGVRLDFDRLAFHFSAIDLGRITWKTQVSNLSLTGDYEFKGLDIFKQILKDTSTTVGSILDTLESIYDIRNTQISYNTPLPARAYVSGTYWLNDTWQVGALAYGEYFRDEFFLSYGLGINARLTSFLQLGAMYAIRHKRFDNLGLNLAMRAGPLQFVAATDNLPAFLSPVSSRNANARFGLNLVFGNGEESRGGKRSGPSRQDDFFKP